VFHYYHDALLSSQLKTFYQLADRPKPSCAIFCGMRHVRLALALSLPFRSSVPDEGNLLVTHFRTQPAILSLPPRISNPQEHYIDIVLSMKASELELPMTDFVWIDLVTGRETDEVLGMRSSASTLSTLTTDIYEKAWYEWLNQIESDT
jgi:hypothetical protein